MGTDEDRALLLACCGLEQMVDLIAYAEFRALVAVGLGARVEPPEFMARAALVATLERAAPGKDIVWSPSPTSFLDQLRSHVRAATSLAMHARKNERGAGARLCPAQVGSLEGIEVLAHLAGEQAGSIREDDGLTISKAIALADFARMRMGA